MLHPKYDDAQTVYGDLIIQLTNAISIIDAAVDQTVPGADDAMFGGDMMKWKQFANSLKLRILVRQASMDGRGPYIQEEVDAIVAEGSGFIEQEVAVNPGFLKEAGKQNPIWDALGWDPSGSQTMTSKATCATDYILDYMINTSDPRIDYLYEKPATGHLGVPQGLLDYDTPVPDAYVPEMVSNIGPGVLKAAEQDAVIFSLAENYFNQAEAANKGYIAVPDEGKDLYEKGITASFEYLGLSSSDAEGYYSLSANLVGWDASSNKIEAIITQKWLAVNGITAEQSWFDYSRTGYPSNLPISLLATTPDRPVRLYYVAGELSSNGANVPTQPNAFTAKVFWAN